MDREWLEQLNLVDLAAVIFMLFGIVRGYLLGLSGELVRVVSLGVVLVLGWQFHDVVGQQVMAATRLDEPAALWAGFLLVAVGAGIAMVLLRWIGRNLVEFTFKGPLEKGGGMAAGLVRSAIWVALAVVAAALSPSDYLRRTFAVESQFGSLVATHLLPAYQELAVGHPDLGLPAIPAEDLPAAAPAREDGEDPDPPAEPAAPPEA